MDGTIHGSLPRPQRLSDTVHSVLEDAIVSGRLQPGEKLYEDRIAEELGVSVTPVREAIARLRREGLVSSQYHRSPSVNVFSEKDIIEIFDLREALESLAVKLASPNLTEDDLNELSATQILGEQHIASGDLMSYATKSNEAFHSALVEAANNGRLSAMMRTIQAQSKCLIAATVRIPGTPRRSIAEHRQIIEAMRNKDVSTAQDTIKAHIRRAKLDMLDNLRESAKDIDDN